MMEILIGMGISFGAGVCIGILCMVLWEEFHD